MLGLYTLLLLCFYHPSILPPLCSTIPLFYHPSVLPPLYSTFYNHLFLLLQAIVSSFFIGCYNGNSTQLAQLSAERSADRKQVRSTFLMLVPLSIIRSLHM